MSRRPVRFFALALTLALLLAALERAAAALRSRWTEPGRGASWIWEPGVLDSGEPVAFFAVRDFELAALAGHKAELAIVADESYTLFVNGRRVGSGAYRGGAPADLYDLTADLRAGKNRLAVELASGRGAGGLLASLRLDGRPVLVSDGEWRVFRRFDGAVLRGWPLAGGEAAQVWQLHPTGRWRVAPPRPRPPRPVLLRGPVLKGAVKMRTPWRSWRQAPAAADRFPRHLGPWLLFDWGSEVTGLLTLELAPADGDAGLLFTGSEIPDRDAPAAAVVIPVPGKGWWIDVRPRTFRYAYLAGLELRRTPEVELVGEELARELEPGAAGPAGVFGVAPPRQRSKAEAKIRRRLRSGDAQ